MRAVFALIALSNLARADDYGGEEDHFTLLTNANFSDWIKEKDLSLVKFFAPWCGHCKAMAPAYNTAAGTLKSENIHLAKVDCTEERELCDRFGVQGFPTLKVFRKSIELPKEYKGGRAEQEIVDYMRRQNMPSITHIESKEDLESFKAKEKVVVVAFHTGKDTPLFEQFSQAAEAHRDDYVFGAVASEEIRKAVEVTEPKIVMYKKFDEGFAHYDISSHGELNQENIKNFIKTASIPLMDDISPENYQSYVQAGKPLGFLFIESEEHRSGVGEQVKAVAKEFKGKVNFCFIDTEKFGSHARNLKLTEGKWPAFAIMNMDENTAFPFDQEKEITTDAVKAHVQGVLDGTIKPTLKSEPLPTSDEGPVKVVVGDSYNDVVNDKTKDVLIEFYAPWCGHCKRLAPTYEELAKIFEPAKDIIVAKMDATENDLPTGTPFSVEGFPTIKFVKAGDNEIVDYSGDRSLDSLYDFIQTNAVNKDQVPPKPEKAEETKEEDATEQKADAGASETEVPEQQENQESHHTEL